MRYLALGRKLGHPDALAADRLHAFMLFPEDEDKRDEFIACYTKVRETFESRAHADRSDLSLASAVAKYATRLTTDSRASIHGTMAGWVLQTIWAIHEHHPEYGATVNKAVTLVAADAARYDLKTFDGCISVPGSTKAVRSAWSTYRNVAHLWAAYQILLSQDIPPVTKRGMPEASKYICIEEMTERSRDWQKLLAIAEEIRKFGDRFFSQNPRAAKGTAVWDQDLVWRAPDGLVPPMRSLVPPPLSEKSLNDLIDYCAKHR